MKHSSPKLQFFKAERHLGLQSTLFSLAVLILAWLFCAAKIDSDLILPTPQAVGIKVLEIVQSEMFWFIIMGSLRHVLLGFGIAFVAGVSTGILSGLLKPMNWFIYPWLLFLRATPVMSFILYLLLFVPTPYVAVWVSFFIVYPIIYTNVLEGFKSVDSNLLEMAKLYKVSFKDQLRHIYIPSIFPYLMAAALTGMGMNIKAVITAEALALPENAIGTELFMARNYLDTQSILAWTVLIIVMAVVLDLCLLAIKWSLTEGRRSYVIQRRES